MWEALFALFQLQALFLVIIGVAVGVVMGAIPGLSGGMTLALALPLTFYMSGNSAIVLLVSIYVGVVAGGLITAIILNIPGTPANLVTAWDGYPMTRKGHAGRALGLGIFASLVGSVISWIILVSFAPLLSAFALQFNHFDYFAMVMMALVLISSLSEGSMVRALMAGLLGMLFALPGIDPVSAQLRLNFGYQQMSGGFHILPVLIGLFGISQVIQDCLRIADQPRMSNSVGVTLPKLATIKEQAVNLIRSSVIGTWIGVLPGLGTTIGSLVAYSFAKNSSKNPEEFGSGIDDGIVASEAANSANIGGGLIPVITLGIPGSVGDVILLAALILHGVTPGPLLFANNPEYAWGIIWTMLVASFVMFTLMSITSPWVARIVNIPRIYVMPAVMILSIVGSFAVNNRLFDVWVMLGSGALGYIMILLRLPLGPFSIGFILAPIAESSLRSGLMASRGSYEPLWTQPVAASLLVIAMLTFFWPLIRKSINHLRRRES